MLSPFLRRSRSVAAVLGLSAVLPLCGAVSAQARDAHACDRIGIEYTADRGQHWLSGGSIAQEAPATRIDVRLKGQPAEGCQYAISLASYSTEGPDWKSSGTQEFLGWDTTVLTRDLAQTALEVTDFAPECFGQIDLYSGDRKYDGKDAPVPHYPDSQIGDHLIAHWNGGTACAPTPPTDTPPPVPTTTTPATTPPAATTPPPAGTPTPSETPGTVPPAPTPSETPAGGTPSPSASTTPPAATTPDEPPTSSTVPGTLAETGSDSTTTLVTALAATTLVAIGVGLFVFTRRRRQSIAN